METVALGSLVWEKGARIPNLDEPGVKNQVAEQMLVKFSDPEFIKRLAYSLLAIFPTLENNDLVWFQPEGGKVPPWGTSLEPEEILQVITDVSNALQGVAPGKTVEDLLYEQQKREKTARIEELERAIAQLKQN